VVNSFFGFLKKKTGVVCLSKGVELKTNKFMSEVLAEVLPSGQPWALCGGPMLSEEIMKGQAGVAVLASKNSLAFKKLIKLFSGSSICLEATNDTISVAVCGVLKNIYAMALGMVDELGWGSNAKAWLVEKSLAEMESVVKKFGGQGKTVYGAAGLGDLLATGFSSFSKNREAGRTIAKTGKCCQGGEGLISFPAILKKLGPQIKKYPVLLALKKILVQKQHAQKALQDFIG
jgi:glycerol-3-phosphate dehydrogenase (NAD(P)+)